jgi:hypothetical protein
VNHSEAIWMLLCLEHWFRIYMDGAPLTIRPSALAGRLPR